MNPTSDSSRTPVATWRPTSRLIIAALVLFVLLGLSHAWHTVDAARHGAATVLRHDALAYAEVLRTGRLTSVSAPFRYRPVTPLLAALAPPPPTWLYSLPRTMSADERLVYRFALVNAVGLGLAAWFLLLLLAELQFRPWECLAGSLLLMVSHFPVAVGTAPLAEAWAFATLAAGLYLLLVRRFWLLGIAFAAGLFNKESALLVPIAAAFLPWARAERIRLLVCFVPTLALYAWFRLALAPDAEPLLSSGWHLAYLERLLASSEWVRLPKSVFLSFGALWIPALFGWRLATPGSPLHRWRPLIPIVLLTPLLLVTDLQRVWFLAFPFVLPLALLGIRSWLPGGAQTA